MAEQSDPKDIIQAWLHEAFESLKNPQRRKLLFLTEPTFKKYQDSGPPLTLFAHEPLDAQRNRIHTAMAQLDFKTMKQLVRQEADAFLEANPQVTEIEHHRRVSKKKSPVPETTHEQQETKHQRQPSIQELLVPKTMREQREAMETALQKLHDTYASQKGSAVLTFVERAQEVLENFPSSKDPEKNGLPTTLAPALHMRLNAAQRNINLGSPTPDSQYAIEQALAICQAWEAQSKKNAKAARHSEKRGSGQPNR